MIWRRGFPPDSRSATLESIEVKFANTPSGLTVKLVTGLLTSTTEVATLSNPDPLESGDMMFTAPSGTTLAADMMRVNGTVNNNAPTASDNTVTTDEDEDYTFRPGDFNFGDTDTSDTLSSVKIVTLETAGDMELNGTDVTENQVISYGDINDGNLVFRPATDGNGSPYDSFTFRVNDGEDDSDAAYTMTVNVDSVPDVTAVEVTSTTRSGTADLKDTYGAGEAIQVTVSFDEVVKVTGAPVFEIKLGPTTTRSASYEEGTDTTALVFEYTVESQDSDDNGI